MTRFLAAGLLVSVTAFALGACNAGSKPKLAPLKCSIDPNHPGPLRRGGMASVEIVGAGVSIKQTKVNALCGPLVNTDVPALNMRAGQGMLFETCLPDGIIQLSAFDRPPPGRQELHSAVQSGGVELLFNQHGGPSFSSRGETDDSVVLGIDLWKANAELVLQDIASGAKLKASVIFDCTGYKTGAPLPPGPQQPGVAAPSQGTSAAAPALPSATPVPNPGAAQ